MEKVSSLMDGEMDDDESRLAYSRVREQPALNEAWSTFHLIGDTMRGEPLLSERFQSDLAKRLAEEPVILAPQPSKAGRVRRYTTYALSAAASVVAMAWVGWIALSTGGPESSQVAVNASTPSRQAGPVAVANPSSTQVTVSPALASVSPESSSSADQYLLAHQGVSPSTAFQGVAPYVRTVSTLQTPAR